jgi:cellulose synthase/poly-beta-1,6-N-acetylglucosamine synthase-like glycosyltransferase
MSANIAAWAIVVALVFFAYTYFGYPLLLRLAAAERRSVEPPDGDQWEWPRVSITVPAYNEEAQIRPLIESLLAIEYPRDRLQILFVSDASSDGTDAIVREYEDRGIELLRMEERGGKTKAENAAAARLTGEIIVNTDASIRIAPDALKNLILAFRDPTVGLASGRDISVGPDDENGNRGESGYVGYEMAVRDLETDVASIVGASGCFYAIRPELHRIPLPESLSRDFASALHTREHGFRAVSVSEAVCLVPRTRSLRKEYRRKVRTITRGMETLVHKRALLNPFRYGAFAWMLFSHKVCRWALPWFGIAAFALVGLAAPSSRWAAAVLAAGAAVLVLALIGWIRAEAERVPRIFSVPAYLVAGNLAAAHALLRLFRGDRNAMWEPTRREAVPPTPGESSGG